MVERCALSGSDLKIKFRTILLNSIGQYYLPRFIYSRSSHIIAEYGSTAGKVDSSARGQLNRENNLFFVPVRACKFGFARRIQPSRPASVW